MSALRNLARTVSGRRRPRPQAALYGDLIPKKLKNPLQGRPSPFLLGAQIRLPASGDATITRQRFFSTQNQAPEEETLQAVKETSKQNAERDYTWLPPNNVHHPVEEQLAEEEELIEPSVAANDQDETTGAASNAEAERSARRKRIAEWSREAATHLDARSNLIRVKRGEHLLPEEAVSALVMNGGQQVTHIDCQDGRHAVIATARSQPQLKKLATVIYHSIKLRKVRHRVDHRPIGMTQGWAVMESGNLAIHIMSQQMRDYYQLESALDPDIKDVLYEELSASMLEQDKAENPKRYDKNARKNKRHFKYLSKK